MRSMLVTRAAWLYLCATRRAMTTEEIAGAHPGWCTNLERRQQLSCALRSLFESGSLVRAAAPDRLVYTYECTDACVVPKYFSLVELRQALAGQAPDLLEVRADRAAMARIWELMITEGGSWSPTELSWRLRLAAETVRLALDALNDGGHVKRLPPAPGTRTSVGPSFKVTPACEPFIESEARHIPREEIC